MTKKKTKKATRISASAARAEGEARTKRALANAKATVAANLKAIALADQENAKKRDERSVSHDGMTASERAMTKAPNGTKAKKRAPKSAKETKAKRVSALDAAATVLASAKEPLRTKDLIEQMAAKGLWTSPAGKTPEATLYAAILREIGTKKGDARFKKVERGHFAATGH